MVTILLGPKMPNLSPQMSDPLQQQQTPQWVKNPKQSATTQPDVELVFQFHLYSNRRNFKNDEKCIYISRIRIRSLLGKISKQLMTKHRSCITIYLQLQPRKKLQAKVSFLLEFWKKNAKGFFTWHRRDAQKIQSWENSKYRKKCENFGN